MWSLRLEARVERSGRGNNTLTVHTASWCHVDFLCAGLRSKLQNHELLWKYKQRECWGKDPMLFAGGLRRDFFFFIIVLKQNPIGNSCDRREGNWAVPLVQLGPLDLTGVVKCCSVSRNSHQIWQLKDLCVFVHMCTFCRQWRSYWSPWIWRRVATTWV